MMENSWLGVTFAGWKMGRKCITRLREQSLFKEIKIFYGWRGQSEKQTSSYLTNHAWKFQHKQHVIGLTKTGVSTIQLEFKENGNRAETESGNDQQKMSDDGYYVNMHIKFYGMMLLGINASC